VWCLGKGTPLVLEIIIRDQQLGIIILIIANCVSCRGIIAWFAASVLVRAVQAMECRYPTGLAEKTVARSVVFCKLHCVSGAVT
jgi:hypothetical protein